MHVDLIESLRCPHPHADGWLVAHADLVVDRRIIRGSVGCPTCGEQWPIEDGALHLAAPVPSIGLHESCESAAGIGDARADALRTAALLDVRDAAGVVLLAGASALAADALASLTGVMVLVVNPPTGVACAHSRLFVGDAVPFGVGSLRGARLDGAHASDAWLDSVTRAVMRGGRVVAPVSRAVPPALCELARDGHEWVAEVQVAASGLVPLRRG